jgi:hypothetical protein
LGNFSILTIEDWNDSTRKYGTRKGGFGSFFIYRPMINIRLQKYKKNRLAGMNKYNAARAAGFSEATAKVHTKELEERANIADVLERQGLTDNALAKKHIELLEAQKVVMVDGKPLEVENGRITLPEYFIQIKALELAYKLKNLLLNKVEHSGEIKGGETKIIIIRADAKKEESGNKTFTISRPVSIQQ